MSRFSGLAKLLRTAGYTVTLGANAEEEPKVKPAEGGEADEDEDEQGGEQPPAGDPPAGDGEDGDDDAGDEGEDQGDEGGEGDGGSAANTAPGTLSAEAQRGYDLANARWAHVMLSPSARGNLNLALDLLAESSMSPEAIIRTCKNNAASTQPGSKHAMRSRLATTPAPGTRISGSQGEDGSDDPAKSARKKAAERANQRTARSAGGRGVNRRPGEAVESK